MCLIPILIEIDGRLQAEIAFVTEQEYQDYKKRKKMPEVYLDYLFLKQFLFEKGYGTIKDELTQTIGLSIMPGENFMFEDAHYRVISVDKVKNILTRISVEYTDFIDAYAEYLKKK